MALHFLIKSTRTPTLTRSPPLKPPPTPFHPIPFTPPHLFLTTRPIPSTPPHLLLTTRAFSSPGENSPVKVVVTKFIKKKKSKNHVSNLLSWVNLQPFPPAVKVVFHTLLKSMLFAIGEKGFELLVRVFNFMFFHCNR